MIPQYSDLKYFLVISDTQNFSRASERLGVVQPTLSQAVKRLEDMAGVPLFIRHKSGVSLTRAGQVLRDQASELLNSWQFLMNEVKEAEILPKGHFVLGVHPSVALYSLKKILPRLTKENDMIEISLSHGLSREILEGVVSSKIDFGLVINARKHPDLVVKKLCDDRVGLWQGTNSNGQILICDPSLFQTQQILKKFSKALQFSRHLTTSNLEVAADLVAANVGVGILPERVALRAGLKPLPGTPWFQDELYLCYRKERQKSVAAKTVIAAILAAEI